MGSSSKLLLLAVLQTVCLMGSHATTRRKIVESFHVRSDVHFRFATTQIETMIRNTAGQAQEIFFDVTLPKEAFIVNFSMEIDGKVYNGEVKEKVAAKKEYLAAVKRGDDAGHVRQAPRHANVFEVSVNVANGSAANFILTYQEMLRRKMGLYEHEIHVNPGQVVDDFLIEIFIQENKPLKYVKTPTLQTGLLMTENNEAENKLIIVDRPSSETAYIKYRPSVADQTDYNVPSRFIVKYDVEHSPGGDVMVVDGYFVHFFAPDLSPMSKDIIFILDVSGSMDGQKLQQLKDAMQTILLDLQPDDRFNIITFSHWVKKWKPELVTATAAMIEDAKDFIITISADGMTDINSALMTGISELKNYEDEQRVGMIFFLTDGIPTEGVMNSAEITANVLDKNGNTSAIFGLAFGSVADYDLLKTISSQHSGFARKIYLDSDAALQVASLYEEISAVSIKDVSFTYLPGSVDEYTVTNDKFPFIFNGSEVAISGKMSNSVEVFQLEIKGIQKSGSYDVVLTVDDVNNFIINPDENLNKFFSVPRDFSGIVEKMWAYLTIKKYLREKEIHVSNKAKVEELESKILQISMKYKFVTPLTSMIVTKPESPESAVESALRDTDDLMHKSSAVKQTSSYLPNSNSYRRPYNHNRLDPHMQYFGGHLHDPYNGFGPLSGHDPNGPLSAHYPMGFGPLSGYDPNGHLSAHYPMDPLPTYTSFVMKMNKAKKQPTTSVDNKKKMDTKFTKRTKSTIQGFFLTTITTETKNLSLCLVPKNVIPGTYQLIRSPNGTELSIETACPVKNCHKCVIKNIILDTNGNRASLSMNNTEAWKNQTFSGFNITKETPEMIIIVVEGLEIRVTWSQKKRSKHYLLNVMMDDANSYEGLIGKILNLSAKQQRKWRRTKVPAVCRSTNLYGYFTKKVAAPYMVKN